MMLLHTTSWRRLPYIQTKLETFRIYKNPNSIYCTYVGMMTFLNRAAPVEDVPPQYAKALAAMEVVVVSMVTFAQEAEQAVQEAGADTETLTLYRQTIKQH